MTRRKQGRVLGDAKIYQLPTPAGGVRIQTFVPWTLVKRRYKKQVITPVESPGEFRVDMPQEHHTTTTGKDSAIVRALGQAYYWQWLLDEQHVYSLSEIAKAEKIDVTQIRRIMRLTLLAPWLIEEILRSPMQVASAVMSLKFPATWKQQFLPTNLEDRQDLSASG